MVRFIGHVDLLRSSHGQILHCPSGILRSSICQQMPLATLRRQLSDKSVMPFLKIVAMPCSPLLGAVVNTDRLAHVHPSLSACSSQFEVQFEEITFAATCQPFTYPIFHNFSFTGSETTDQHCSWQWFCRDRCRHCLPLCSQRRWRLQKLRHQLLFEASIR